MCDRWRRVVDNVDPVETGVQTCYRHPDRRAGVRCQRCERPICPDCMVQASVGFHCPHCVSGGGQRVYTARTLPVARPVLTYVLVALNVAVFLAMMSGGQGLQDTGGMVENPSGPVNLLIGPEVYRDGVLVALGLDGGSVADPAAVVEAIGVAEGEWWRIVTSGFLHGGLLHLGMNMLFLWIVGPQIEAMLGRLTFGLLYFSSLLAGSFGVLLLDPFVPTLGASGALFGLMGVAVVVQRARGIDPWRSGIAGLIVLNLIITFTVPDISIGGHLGGLVGGFAAGWAAFEVERRTRSALASSVILVVLGSAFFAAAVWAAEAAVDLGHPVVQL